MMMMMMMMMMMTVANFNLAFSNSLVSSYESEVLFPRSKLLQLPVWAS